MFTQEEVKDSLGIDSPHGILTVSVSGDTVTFTMSRSA